MFLMSSSRVNPKWAPTSPRIPDTVPSRNESVRGMVIWCSPSSAVVSRIWLPVCRVIPYPKPFKAVARSSPERSRGNLIMSALLREQSGKTRGRPWLSDSWEVTPFLSINDGLHEKHATDFKTLDTGILWRSASKALTSQESLSWIINSIEMKNLWTEFLSFRALPFGSRWRWRTPRLIQNFSSAFFSLESDKE